jgi:hypothetical protein
VGIENHFSQFFSDYRKRCKVIFNTYKNNEKTNLVRRQKLKASVWFFLFAYYNVSDCFYDGLMPRFSIQFTVLSLQKKLFGFLWHLGHRENNYILFSGK